MQTFKVKYWEQRIYVCTVQVEAEDQSDAEDKVLNSDNHICGTYSEVLSDTIEAGTIEVKEIV